jgi:mRNA degradation ribonuclease J1/J2
VKGITIPIEDLEKFKAFMTKASEQKAAVKLSGTSENALLEMELDGERISYPATEVSVERKLDEFPDSDILEVCRKYYNAIKSVVEECTLTFKDQS